jgi:hypothetical protein
VRAHDRLVELVDRAEALVADHRLASSEAELLCLAQGLDRVNELIAIGALATAWLELARGVCQFGATTDLARNCVLVIELLDELKSVDVHELAQSGPSLLSPRWA